MKQHQIYGRVPKNKCLPDKEKYHLRHPDTADFVFLIGTVFILLFLYRMTANPAADTDRSAFSQQAVTAVMSMNVSKNAEEGDRIREVTGEPFGYMSGEWNLWEYIGDVMASLLTGE